LILSSKIDPTTLKIFLTIIEEASLARAAERHFMATSAVSKRISDLEDTLAVQLLERHSGGVRPTAAGSELVSYAKEMLLLLARMRADLSGFGEGVKGDVNVFANSTSIVGFLGKHMRGFLGQYPDVHVRLEEWSSPYIVRSVRDGIADIGIFWSGAAPAGLTIVPYHPANLVVVVPHDHVLARETHIAFAQTLDYDHIAFHEGSLLYRMTQQAAVSARRSIRTRLQVTSFDAVRTMVRVGLGLAVMTDVTVGQLGDQAGFAVIPLSDAWASLEIVIGFREFETLPRAAQHFVTHLQTASRRAD
jgi:DNA-binding transcriptional LysR family regulator